MDGAAFNFLEVDAVAGERFECGKESARFVGEAQGERHFIGLRQGMLCDLCGRDKQDEASEIFGIVVNVFGKDYAAIDGGCTMGGDSGEGFFTARNDFADAASSVFRRDAF